MIAALSYASPLSAQSWITLPNGGWGYITDYTTTGFFQCGDPFYLIEPCHASVNTLTLANGANTMTLAFHGVSQVITATNTSKRYRIGKVTKTFSGPGKFTFPTAKHLGAPLFFFSIAISTSFPLPASTGVYNAGYLPTSLTTIPPNCCEGSATSGQLPVSPMPSPYTGYSHVDWGSFLGTTMTASEEGMDITANAGLVPEPATIWLTASGLIGVFSIVRARRKRSK